VRLCRHPQEGHAWLWGHVFLDGRIGAFTQHDVPCEATITPVQGRHVVYRSDGGWSRLTLERNGTLGALRGVTASGVYSMHDLRHVPHGPGPLAVSIEASFVPSTVAVSNLAGRNEVLGDVQARVAIGQHAFELVGRGQYHEQVQTEPRFTTPFTYGTLRGARAGVVFVRGARGARGHWIEGDTSTAIDRIELAPPGSTRAVRLYSGQRLREGVLKTTYDYTIAIGDGIRPGALVEAEIDGVALSGCVNDYLVDELRYERI
jgi:hypothetical protein